MSKEIKVLDKFLKKWSGANFQFDWPSFNSLGIHANLTPLSLFWCQSCAAHHCHNPDNFIIPLSLSCPFYFSTLKLNMQVLKTIFLALWLSWFYHDNSVKSCDLHKSNFACFFILKLKLISLFPCCGKKSKIIRKIIVRLLTHFYK